TVAVRQLPGAHSGGCTQEAGGNCGCLSRRTTGAAHLLPRQAMCGPRSGRPAVWALRAARIARTLGPGIDAAHRVPTCPRPPLPEAARRPSRPGSWIRGACGVAVRGSVSRADRTDGGSPPTSRGAKRPRLVRGTWVVHVWVRVSRRCAAWALRACGFAVGAVRVAADRSRVAG